MVKKQQAIRKGGGREAVRNSMEMHLLISYTITRNLSPFVTYNTRGRGQESLCNWESLAINIQEEEATVAVIACPGQNFMCNSYCCMHCQHLHLNREMLCHHSEEGLGLMPWTRTWPCLRQTIYIHSILLYPLFWSLQQTCLKVD